MVESRRKLIWTRKIARGVILPSFHLMTSNPFFNKSLLGSLTMLSKLPSLSTTSSPILSHPKQSGMYSRRTTFTPLSRRNALSSRSIIDRIVSNLPSTMKIGQWKIGRGSCGQIRPRLTGLGQMEGSIPGNQGVRPFQTAPPLLLSSMEEETIS